MILPVYIISLSTLINKKSLDISKGHGFFLCLQAPEMPWGL